MARSPFGRFLAHAIFAALSAAALAAGLALAAALPLPDRPDDYNSAGFVVRHGWQKIAYAGTTPFRDGSSSAEEDAAVARYFELTAGIRDAERAAGDTALDEQARQRALASLGALRAERDGLENAVERILEGRLTEVVENAGLTRTIGRDFVWPPVDVELEDPPAVLVVSPRGEIRIERESLLQGDLPIDRVQRIEAEAERDGDHSALVEEISGIAIYPAIVPVSSEYRDVARTMAHEWTHHYLYFTPLGRRYFAGGDARTLNETLAEIVGRELGDALVARYPLPEPATPPPGVQDTDGVRGNIDYVAEMRGLRRDVEALLAAGDIDAAERLMEEKRRFLADNGYYIRRLNQAYFAFHGSYAGSAGSIDPIGPKFDTLRQRSATLRDFVRTAERFTSRADLDEALSVP